MTVEMLRLPPPIGMNIDGTYDFPKTQTEGVEGQTSRQELVFLRGMAEGKKEADSLSSLPQAAETVSLASPEFSPYLR